MEKNIQNMLWSNFNLIMEHLPGPGLLMVCGNRATRENLITLGWMTFGVSWNEPIVTIYVRKSRFSYDLLMQNPEFTLNVMPESFNDAIKFCGTTSGRYCDKFAETKLRKNNPVATNVSTLKDAIISMECKIIDTAELSPDKLSDLVNAKYYKDGDYHQMFTAVIKSFNVNLQGQ